MCRRAPAIPLSRAGRRRCSETPYVHTCALRESSAGAAQRESRERRRHIYIDRNGGFARVARCVHAMAPALRAHARPYSRVLAGHRKRDREQLRVACVQCCLCKECGCEQSWQHCVSHGVQRACALGEARPVGIIPRACARESGRRGLASERVRSEPVVLWCPMVLGGIFFPLSAGTPTGHHSLSNVLPGQYSIPSPHTLRTSLIAKSKGLCV